MLLCDPRLWLAAGMILVGAAGAEPLQQAASTSTIVGHITFAGPVPKSAVPDDAGLRRDLIEVGRPSGGLRGVVAHLTGPTNSAPDSAAVRQAPPVVVDQLDSNFTPRVVAVREGVPVVFTNSDPANHNVRTTSLARSNQFNVFTGNAGRYEHRFIAEKPGQPVHLGCDIHPWMRGWVFVFSHDQFAVTDEAGRFKLSQVPPGEHTLVLQQPDLRYRKEQMVNVAPGQTFEFTVEIRADELPKAVVPGER